MPFPQPAGEVEKVEKEMQGLGSEPLSGGRTGCEAPPATAVAPPGAPSRDA